MVAKSRKQNGNASSLPFQPQKLSLQRIVSSKKMPMRIAAAIAFIFIVLRFTDCLHQIKIHNESLALYFNDTSFLPPPPQTKGRRGPVEFLPKPLMIETTETLTNVTRLQRRHDDKFNFPHYIRDRRNRYWVDHGVDRHKAPEELEEGCEYEAEWMTDHHPSCNYIHTIDMTDFFFSPKRHFVKIRGHKRRKKFRLIGSGGFRSAFLFHEYDGTRRVIKTLLYRDDRSVSPRMADRMRRDAVVSEQLTSSKYIADIYGYCGQAALVDYSEEEDMLKLFRQGVVPEKDALFQIAHDVAQSVADAHHFNDKGRATIAHMDIKPNQWIWLQDRFVLNDFNLARLLTWDPVKKKNCYLTSGYSEGRWQAPEQFEESAPRSEKADTFSLGYILNFLVTGEKPFPGFDGRQVQNTVTNGTMWKITDPEIVKSKHPFDVNVRKAVDMCLKFKPEDRPRAQEVADFLRTALTKYKESKKQ